MQPGQVAIPPALRHRVLPVYPPSLVHAGAEPVTVIVRVAIDREGNVTGIQPVIMDKSGVDHARFVAAVRNAVSQWRFYPYRVQTHEPDGVVSQAPMPVTLRYAFEFTVDHGKPAVQSRRK
ncbi:MAG TPA: energy transducer TonB [Oleiagrimonas sp.]|nr:energy transducer TonB [Oleiagrimonas sp.]